MIHNPLELKGMCVISMDFKPNSHFLNQGSKLTVEFHKKFNFIPVIPLIPPIPPIPLIPSIPPIPLVPPIALIPHILQIL